ncbi:MAG: hypothetical protein GKR77_03830 [Legionellales bacterium]|nr:hypothetical protein [Legionellales bacterium]
MIRPSLIDTHKFIILLACLLVFFIVSALTQDSYFKFIISLLFATLMMLSLYLISHRKRLLITGTLILGSLTTLSFFSDATLSPDVTSLIGAEIILAILFFSVLLFASLHYTVRDSTITLNHLCGAVCTYLFIGLTWSYLYLLIELLQPESFYPTTEVVEQGSQSLKFIYYSFVTLTTLGYGDIRPISDIAKTTSWLEAATGQLYLTILIAQLIGKYVARTYKSTG